MGNLQISYIEINKWLYVLLGLQNYHNGNMFFFLIYMVCPKNLWILACTLKQKKKCDTHVYSMYKNYVNFPSEKW